MSSEDTELTFVRCPSCRSLVPAVATRCRMCGHQFSSQEESSSSVEAEAPQESIKEQAIPMQSVQEPGFEEPVKNKIEQENPDKENIGQEDFEQFEQKQFEQRVEQNSFDETSNDSIALGSTTTSFNNENAPSSRSLNFKSDLKDTEQQKIEKADSFEESSFNSHDRDNDIQDSPAEPKRKKRRRKRKKKPNENNFRSSEETLEKEDTFSKSSFEGSSRVESKSVADTRNVEKKASKSGVLVGWLVSYSSDANGFSIELRTGKFFVAKQKLREDDLIIPDSAISTPHCLLKVSRGSLQIQDLMSEQGTFVMKKGSNDFVSSDEVKSVEHGDKIKFGAYELLVCLVPKS